MNQSKKDEITFRAVRIAQETARQRGLKVGDIVAHPSERTACRLQEIRGDKAVIGWKDIRHEVPLNELFDPDVAHSEAIRIRDEAN